MPPSPTLRSGRLTGAALAACLLVSPPALAAIWSIDETIVRGETELFWTSPSAVALGASGYSWSYEVAAVSATVLGAPLEVTELIGDSFPLTLSGQSGGLPFLLVDQQLAEPATGTAARVRIEVDAAGFGRAAITEAVFGSLDLGGGSVIDIDAIRIEATVTVEPAAAPPPGDYSGDGSVDVYDYVLWASAYGSSDPQTDGNADGSVNAADYTVWRDAAASAAFAAPEPSGALLLACGLAGLGRRGERRR
ncbi:hypothetical protein [Botrimarina sp.]|uniref:hypothetical protein n=1 Tax=Botrimarina sp. TaxID=2795802 RepID=UPI0032EE21F6